MLISVVGVITWVLASSTSQAQLFQCQPSGDNEQVFPNIPDVLFDSTEAANSVTGEGSSLTPLQPNVAYIFTIPGVGDDRNCSGNVIAFEYCYQLGMTMGNRPKFEFLQLTRGSQPQIFTVDSIFGVRDEPICADIEGSSSQQVCCTRSTNQHEAPTTEYTIGIGVSNDGVRPLAFSDSLTEYNSNQIYQTTNNFQQGDEITANLLTGASIPLLRFYLVPVAPTPGPESTSITPTDPASESPNDSTDPAGNGSNAGVAVGVVFGLLLVIALIASVVVVVVVILKRQYSWKLGLPGSRGVGMSINNEVYGTGLGLGEQAEEYATIDYAEEGPLAYSMNPSEYEQPTATLKYALTGAGMKEEKTATWNSESIYMVPGCDEDTLYCQLDEIQTNRIPRREIRLGDPLGSGQFGMVCEGVMNSSAGEDVDVAVKMLKQGSDEQDRVKFLQEAAIMGQFKHPNVVTMYGVVTEGEPVLLVLELLSKGDLRNHLVYMKTEEGDVNVDDHTLLSYCRQVASGMTYLSGKDFVHRDLAARNILLTDKLICKIADFGMSRDLMDEGYYVSHGGKIPVKWTAPEALHYKKYSTASDVWSYGALMYEIWSVGHKPYENFTISKVIELVETGFRLAPPPGCPRALYSIMISCWHPTTTKRPSFADVSNNLSLPDTELLKWSKDDKSTHPGAEKLGADLLLAQDVYKDLQDIYKGNNYV